MSNQHFHPSTAEIVVEISATQRRIAEAHDELDGLIIEARERIAQTRELLARTDRMLACFDRGGRIE